MFDGPSLCDCLNENGIQLEYTHTYTHTQCPPLPPHNFSCFQTQLHLLFFGIQPAFLGVESYFEASFTEWVTWPPYFCMANTRMTTINERKGVDDSV